ncbi:MAG: MFS transporter [Caulobacterales bacterium]
MSAEAPVAGPKLGLSIKVSYGLGSVAQATAGVALGAAIIGYYLNQVVGLSPLLASSLILISLIVDAVLDPVIGRVSDTFKSRWGRRHPFMYASALPIGLSIYFLWHPPIGLPTGELAAFVLTMLVVLRVCVSLYQIPSDALAPELAPDYHERTVLISYRWFFGVFGALVLAGLLFIVFIRKDAAHPLGPLNREGYAQFGLVAAIITFLAVVISSRATHRYIKTLHPAPVRKLTGAETAREITAILTNRSFLVIILSGVFGGAALGLNDYLGTYLNYHFWRLTPQIIGVMVALLGPLSAVGIFLAPVVSRLLDKKLTMIAVLLGAAITGVAPIILRLLGLMPANGSVWVPVILMFFLFVTVTLGLMGWVIMSSMVADVVEDAAVKTGVRPEGLLFAVVGFLPKITGGLGGVMGGAMLSFVHFPPAAVPGTVAPDILRHLVYLSMPTGIVLGLISTGVLIFYTIDQSAHERNLEHLRGAPTIGDLGDGDGDGSAEPIAPLHPAT